MFFLCNKHSNLQEILNCAIYQLFNRGSRLWFLVLVVHLIEARGIRWHSVYCATKAAIIILTLVSSCIGASLRMVMLHGDYSIRQVERHDKLLYSLMDVFLLFFESNEIHSTEMDLSIDHYATDSTNDLG